jgi:hypothetical protein
MKTPSHSTVLIWIKKLGVYRLCQTKEIADDWVLIIDESIEFGHDKILLVLGIREAHIDFGKPLRYEDMICLRLLISSSWKGEEIKDVLSDIKKEIGGVKYVVADNGNAITKALKLELIPHIEDVTHKMSLFIKELYGKDETFQSYTKKLAFLRGVLGLSNMSHILPPKQRSHSRFMNLKPAIWWGMAVLKMLESPTADPDEKERMKFIKDFEPLIVQIHQLIEIANKILFVLKHKGLSQETTKECLALFEHAKDLKVLRFKQMMESFLYDQLSLMKGKSIKLVCSSDIIESSFGKYKNYISNNKSVGITDLSLSIPAFCGNLNYDEVFSAMENVKLEKLKKWNLTNIGLTQTKKRKESLKRNEL